MAAREVFSFDVPAEGFPAMSLPVSEDNRLSADDIGIEYCTPSDLVEWSLLVYEAFPKAFWKMVEVQDDERYSLPLRMKAMAKHWLPWLSQPGFHAIKAVHKRTGEMLGVAGWYECGPHAVYPETYAVYPDADARFPPWFVPCAWRNDLITTSLDARHRVAMTEAGRAAASSSIADGGDGGDPLSIVARMGWTAEDVAEMTGFHSDGYWKEFGGYDIARLREMRDQPHWYLAPFAVWEKWRRRGVGGALMRWGLDRADESNWPVVLEATPNGRPVYYRYGFRPTAEHGTGKDAQLVRPAKGTTQ